MGRHSTRELANLLLDEAGQAVAIVAVGDFPQEGLQVLADDGGEYGVLGVAGLKRAVAMGQPLAWIIRET